MNSIRKMIPLSGFAAILLSGTALTSCNQQGSPAGTQQTTENTAASSDDIVYVDADTLLAKYEYFQTLQKELEEKGKALENEISRKTSDFQNKVSSYQQNAATMTPGERQSTEQSLGKAQQELQSLQQKVGGDLRKAQEDANEKLHVKVQDFLREYAKLNDYKFVLTYSRSNNAVLFADSTLDVTEEVLNGLNAAYAKEKDQPAAEKK